MHLAGADRLVEVVDMPETECGQIVVALVHLAHHPLQGVRSLLRIGDDRGDQMRDALVLVELDTLGVDQHHPDLVGRGTDHDRGDQRVHETRLAGAGRAGDQQMRHLRDVGDDVAALDVLAQTHGQRVMIVARLLAAQDVAQRDDLLVPVGDLDADGRASRDRAEDAHIGGTDRVGDVLGQAGDLLHLDAVADLDLVAGHRRATGVAGHPRVDVELGEDIAQPSDDGIGRLGASLRDRAGLQHAGVGKRVDDVTRQRELLRALRNSGVRRRLQFGRRRLGLRQPGGQLALALALGGRRGWLRGCEELPGLLTGQHLFGASRLDRRRLVGLRLDLPLPHQRCVIGLVDPVMQSLGGGLTAGCDLVGTPADHPLAQRHPFVQRPSDDDDQSEQADQRQDEGGEPQRHQLGHHR
ncbi:hypothetical protein SDC9_96051 [bioreactor metagenome]|uniref:Uncharacterized protein n=1 Tax=bioreactor metagenome TaxID=1076179 RepID=A0A645A885_9ZZZZ